MDRMINYQITEDADGLRIEQFLRQKSLLSLNFRV